MDADPYLVDVYRYITSPAHTSYKLARAWDDLRSRTRPIKQCDVWGAGKRRMEYLEACLGGWGLHCTEETTHG